MRESYLAERPFPGKENGRMGPFFLIGWLLELEPF